MGKIGDSFPERLVPHGRVTKYKFDIACRVTLGESHDIWEICTHTFEIGADQLV